LVNHAKYLTPILEEVYRVIRATGLYVNLSHSFIQGCRGGHALSIQVSGERMWVFQWLILKIMTLCPDMFTWSYL